MRLIVGISGATGSIYGIRLLEVLKEKKIETHLIIASASEKIIPRKLRIASRRFRIWSPVSTKTRTSEQRFPLPIFIAGLAHHL